MLVGLYYCILLVEYRVNNEDVACCKQGHVICYPQLIKGTTEVEGVSDALEGVAEEECPISVIMMVHLLVQCLDRHQGGWWMVLEVS